MEEKKLYQKIGEGRLLDINVFLDDQKIYEGRIEEAPEEIKNLRYSKVEMGKPLTYYTYSAYNEI